MGDSLLLVSYPPLIRSCISSALSDLDTLHEIYKWIPSSEQIRPSPELILLKKAKIELIQSKWVSFKDYVLHTVFQKPYITRLFDNLLYVDDDNISNEKVFELCKFPYNMEVGQHYVLWYGQEKQGELTAEGISNDIEQEITKRLLDPHGYFDFAWYINPKMTIPELFHVQVFWIQY
jgi:hypothetical protein